ncbi:calcium-dependent protein kinase 16-like [Telopea speciosissima]|uniref:calcium-dependent protein kinase 16-like n=1 Tax=Telopea speciosissima TaxID=54955 RepID=UPI001CC5A77A|nr:calcium-dependent protein kinase 16-like [Telopea speciosissima]
MAKVFINQFDGSPICKHEKLFCKIMGICLSTTKVSDANSNAPSNNNSNSSNKNNKKNQKESSKTCSTAATQKDTSHHPPQKPYESHKNRSQQQQKDKGHSRWPSGVTPYGKRTDFGYAKDFDNKYSIGKLLGHGQFGYTFVATNKSTGEQVVVKRIEKNKVVHGSAFHSKDSGKN